MGETKTETPIRKFIFRETTIEDINKRTYDPLISFPRTTPNLFELFVIKVRRRKVGLRGNLSEFIVDGGTLDPEGLS